MLSRITCSTLLTIALVFAHAACENPPTAMVNRVPVEKNTAGAKAEKAEKKKYDGLACKKDSECESDHCSNNICCSKGECCKDAEDCMLDTGDSVVCEDNATCQGSRGTPICSTKFRCTIKEGGTPDDSGCNAETEANDCGLYKSVFCNGTDNQKAPNCPDSCTTNEECDEGAHCANGKCTANVPNGTACGSEFECESGYCNNGICCTEGDCCTVDTDCDPTKYGAPASCTDPKMCQGTRMAAACIDFHCGSRMEDDDSACDRNVVSDACGGLPVKCRGGVDQQAPPPCATGTCGGWGASSCNEGAFCWENRCTPDQPDGESCTNDTSCQSGHCVNNVCCSAGECCTSDDQCKPEKTCENAMMCQGKRQDFHCDVEHGSCVKSGAPVEDDSGCAGKPTGLMCGKNLPKPCGMGADLKPPTTMIGDGCLPCTTTYVCTPPEFPVGRKCHKRNPSLCTLMQKPMSEGGTDMCVRGPLSLETGDATPRAVGCVGSLVCSALGKCQ